MQPEIKRPCLTIRIGWDAIETLIKCGSWSIENLLYYEPPGKDNRLTVPAEILLEEANNRLAYAIRYLSGPLPHREESTREYAKKVITPEDIKYIRIVLQSVREGLVACGLWGFLGWPLKACVESRD